MSRDTDDAGAIEGPGQGGSGPFCSHDYLIKKKRTTVIALTRLNGHPVMVNSDLIEQIEETPDTVVTLTSGNRIIVRDSMHDIQRKIVEFKRRIHGPSEGN